MVEKVILDFLVSRLSVPVFLERPDLSPLRFVLLEKTGSGRRNRLSSATFAFQSYAESLYQAALLNEQVKMAVEDLVLLEDISRVQLNSDYNFTDISTKQHRYQAVYDVAHY